MPYHRSVRVATGTTAAPNKRKASGLRDDQDRFFRSVAEYNHFLWSEQRGARGEISCLIRQARYPMHVNGVLVCTYVADEFYVRDGHNYVIDVKGQPDPVYKLKRKLFAALFGYYMVEVPAKHWSNTAVARRLKAGEEPPEDVPFVSPVEPASTARAQVQQRRPGQD